MSLPDHIAQPGPIGAPYRSAKTRLVDLEFDLPSRIPLDQSLAQALSTRGLSSAFIRLTDAKMSGLTYVIPDLAPDAAHVAWYSPTHHPALPGTITHASITCGTHNGAPFFHCHAMFQDAQGQPRMGHLLLETCIPTQPVRVKGFGYIDAHFCRVHDQQTGFDLFVPERIKPVQNTSQGILLRIAPNIEIGKPLINVMQNAGWQQAEIYGIGSTIGAHFDDGRIMDSFATELLILNGQVDLKKAKSAVTLNIALVGLGGAVMQGYLKPHANPVLITAELLLRNTL